MTNQFQQVIGICISAMPGARRSITVAMILMELSSEPTQKIAMLNSHSVCPRPSPGPVIAPMALSGGYAVQPDSGPPPGPTNEAIRTTKDAAIIQNELALSRG